MVDSSIGRGWVTLGETVPLYDRSSHPVLRGPVGSDLLAKLFRPTHGFGSANINVLSAQHVPPDARASFAQSPQRGTLPGSEPGFAGPMASEMYQYKFSWLSLLPHDMLALRYWVG